MYDALEVAAAALRGLPNPIVLCCGSVFVAADMRSALAVRDSTVLRPDDWAFEECNEPPLLMMLPAEAKMAAEAKTTAPMAAAGATDSPKKQKVDG